MSDKLRTYPSGMTRDEWIAYWDDDSWKSDELTIDVVVNDDIRAAMKEITRQDTEIASLTADLAEARDRIAAIEEDNKRLGAVVCQTDTAELNTFQQAVEIVTEPGHPCRAFIADGWAMISEDRYYDLLSDTAEELHADIAEAREAARELHRDLLSEGLRSDVVRWPWLEEDEQ